MVRSFLISVLLALGFDIQRLFCPLIFCPLFCALKPWLELRLDLNHFRQPNIQATTMNDSLSDSVKLASMRAQMVDLEALIRFIFPSELQVCQPPYVKVVDCKIYH
jgi:hypothetical protein